MQSAFQYIKSYYKRTKLNVEANRALVRHVRVPVNRVSSLGVKNCVLVLLRDGIGAEKQIRCYFQLKK